MNRLLPYRLQMHSHKQLTPPILQSQLQPNICQSERESSCKSKIRWLAGIDRRERSNPGRFLPTSSQGSPQTQHSSGQSHYTWLSGNGQQEQDSCCRSQYTYLSSTWRPHGNPSK
mmetsp:Transcript_39338/g.65970  ORF Transcript_39338/g.65970 Transcript_39338/m.65970 type:complete len:115 (+) Transcript_39338:105-449(+)